MSRFLPSRFPPCRSTGHHDRMQNLEDMYTELVELSQERKDRLEDSRKLWQFFSDIAEEEAWIKEKEQMLSSADIGRDLTSINLLLTKQRVRHSNCFVTNDRHRSGFLS